MFMVLIYESIKADFMSPPNQNELTLKKYNRRGYKSKCDNSDWITIKTNKLFTLYPGYHPRYNQNKLIEIVLFWS